MTALHSALLLSGYVLTIIGLNLICYLISSFYQKKFGEASPRLGFMSAGALSVLLAVALWIPLGSASTTELVQVALLWSSGVLSAVNSVQLYYTMKRVRK
jgi:hypothetical protein